MKKSNFILLIIILIHYTCKKVDTIDSLPITENKGCIQLEQISPPYYSGYSINTSSISIINGLFLSNHIDKSKYRFHYYADDSLQTLYSPFTKYDYKVVRGNEFTNGLEIFTGEILFQFKNNILNYQNGNSTNGTSLNTLPRLTIGQIRTLFLGSIEQFDHKEFQYKDSCFTAEFGYFNLNNGIPNTTERLIKSWKVTIKGLVYPSEYPIAYYQDGDGKLIYYSNGIVTFH